MNASTPDPDAVVKWRSDRRATYDRINELSRKATREGLTDAELSEHQELTRRVGQTLAAWAQEVGING